MSKCLVDKAMGAKTTSTLRYTMCMKSNVGWEGWKVPIWATRYPSMHFSYFEFIYMIT